MKQEKEIDELINNSLGINLSSGSMFSNLASSEKKQQPAKEQKPNEEEERPRQKVKPTIEQIKAVKASQNETRGLKGKPKGKRTLVGFHVSDDIIARIEDLTFLTGKSKNALYNEALDLLLKKYRNM